MLRALFLSLTLAGSCLLIGQSRLADGTEFPSWERSLQFSRTYYIDGKAAQADDNGPGTRERPFRTIGKAAAGPDRHTIETTVREQVFAPIERHLGYIRVKGLRFEHAGNGFPVPQRGLVSTSRGHHWIIENNTIQWANSVGLDVGKEHWSASTPEIPGFHVIRNNIIRYAGICGIAGPLVHNMLVERNLIEYTGWQDAQRMYESAGVKFHNTENLLFRDNVIRHVKSGSGIWLDVGNVNCRLTRNVIADVSTFSGAIHVEGSHEENLIDHNIISGVKKNAWEPGGQAAEGWAIFADGTDNLVIAHNLILNAENAGFRSNPVFSRLVGGRGGTARSHKIYNNIFCGAGRAAVEFATEFNELDGNLYGAMPGGFIRILAPAPPQYLDLAASREFHGWERNGRVAELKATFDPDTLHVTLVTPAELPKVKVYRDLSADYFGKSSGAMRYPGPFADLDRAYGPRNVDPRQK